MTYQWVKFAHVVSAVAFVAVHGASIALLYVARRERDRIRLQALLDFSGRTASAMYLVLGAIVVSGLGMAAIRTDLFGERWYWASLLVLAATTGLMVAVAKPFTARLRTACELRPSGVPRVSDEELAALLRSGKAHAVAAIGFISLGALLYLMVFQPSLGAGTGSPPVVTTIPGDSDLLARGKEVFEVTANCAGCHGLDGRGSDFAPNIAGKTRDDIETALEFVVPMSALELTEEELEAVAYYVGQLPR